MMNKFNETFCDKLKARTCERLKVKIRILFYWMCVAGCLLSVFQVFLGVQAGTTLSFYSNWKGRVTRWIVWGTVTGVLAGILCLASKEEGWIPVNKNLW
jgi:hypothetical protein